MAIRKLGALLTKQSISPGGVLLAELSKEIELESVEGGRTSSTHYSPSGISGCERELFYKKKSVPGESDVNSSNVLICDTGSFTHEYIQSKLVNLLNREDMQVEWVDVGDYLEENNRGETLGTIIKERVGTETKVYNQKYDISCMLDGIVKIKGKYYILEIKTMVGMLYNRSDDAWNKHKDQATCYSIVSGIDEVIFLYVNRDVCTMKTFEVSISPNMRRNIINKIRKIDSYATDNMLPPRDTSGCKYCKYKTQCRFDGQSGDIPWEGIR